MMQNGRYSKCVVSYASQHMIRVFDCADLDIYFFRSSAHLISSKLFHGNNDNIYVQRNILLSIILHTKHISQLRLRLMQHIPFASPAVCIRLRGTSSYACSHACIHIRTANNRKVSPLSHWSKVHLFYEQKKNSYFVFDSIVKMLNLLRDYLLRQSCSIVYVFVSYTYERRVDIPVFWMCLLPSMWYWGACVRFSCG